MFEGLTNSYPTSNMPTKCPCLAPEETTQNPVAADTNEASEVVEDSDEEEEVASDGVCF